MQLLSTDQETRGTKEVGNLPMVIQLLGEGARREKQVLGRSHYGGASLSLSGFSFLIYKMSRLDKL